MKELIQLFEKIKSTTGHVTEIEYLECILNNQAENELF